MEHLIQCGICLENYNANERAPRVLPCQHSLCNVCLPQLVTKEDPRDLRCHICRRTFRMHTEDVPKNILIVQLLDTIYAPNNSALAAAPPSSVSSNAASSNYEVPMPNAPPPPYPTSSTPTAMPQLPSSLAAAAAASGSSANSQQRWDDRKYLLTIFANIDNDRDGEINAHELHEALRRGSPSSDFDPKTVQLLLAKYDRNGDGLISFNEFSDLFVGLNNQYNNFLDVDLDMSGSIDSGELGRALARAGHSLSPRLLEKIVNTISRHTHTRGISFDIYCRVIARFDFLFDQFRKSHQHHSSSHEDEATFIGKKFFEHFW